LNPGPHRLGQDGQLHDDRIARHQRSELAAARDAKQRTRQETAVRLEADHARLARAERRLHGLDHERRADARTRGLEQTDALEQRVAADRRRDEARSEETRGEDARHVAAQELAVLIGDERPICVAVRGDQENKPCSRAQPRARATSSARMASVSTGTKRSDQPSRSTSAPRPARISTRSSRPTAE
jgi:hypothetical protein